MRVLVTGGAGYIGCVLVEALLRESHRVIVVDDFRNGPTLGHLVRNQHLEIVKGDVRDMRVLYQVAPRADVVIPLAAVVGAPACDKNPREASETNVNAIRALLNRLSDEQIVLYPNTNSGYGIGGEAACTEDSPLRPISLYGQTKCKIEEDILQRENAVVFRLATVFGTSARMRTDLLVNDFALMAATGTALKLYQPNARRNYVHVVDVAQAFVGAIHQAPRMAYKVYNCGDTRANMTKGKLAYMVNAIAMGHGMPGMTVVEVDGADPDKRDYIVLNDRLEATGWRPTVTIDAGITELLQYYRMSSERRGNA